MFFVLKYLYICFKLITNFYLFIMNLPFNYSDELTNQVKKNWLTLENKNLFIECKTNNDFCLTFARLSIQKNCELSLSGKIIDLFLKDIFTNKDNYK